jgi:hypothetical protein
MIWWWLKDYVFFSLGVSAALPLPPAATAAAAAAAAAAAPESGVVTVVGRGIQNGFHRFTGTSTPQTARMKRAEPTARNRFQLVNVKSRTEMLQINQ